MSSFKPYLATVALAFTACARPVASNSDSLEASLRTACRTQARACVKLSKQGWRTPPRDLEDACAAARPDSCFELGLRLIDGDGVAKNEARGREMLGRSCAHGHPTACGVAGSRRLANGLASQDEAEILSSQREADALLDKACKGGALPSCVILGDSRMETGGAEPVLQRACDGGEAGGCTRLGVAQLAAILRQKHIDVPAQYFLELRPAGVQAAIGQENAKGICALFRRGCDGGDDDGCETFGTVCSTKFGAAVKSLRSAERSCEKGELGESCVEAGNARELGRGCKADPEKASALYNKGCELHDVASCLAAARLAASGKLQGSDPALARQRALSTCDGKYPGACRILGKLFLEGDPVFAKDAAQAARLFARGCEQNDVTSCADHGQLVRPTDPAAALRSFRRACDLRQPASCVAAAELLEASGQREEATALQQAACFGDEVRGCAAGSRLGAAGSAVASTILVKIDKGGNADALMFIPGTPLLLVSENGRLRLVDSAAAVSLSPILTLSSARIPWRAPYGNTMLERDVRYLQPAWNKGRLVGLIQDTGGQMHLWRPGLPLHALASGKSNARPPTAQRPGHAQAAITLSETSLLGGRRVQLIDLDTGAALAETPDLGETVLKLSFSADGKRLAVGLDKGDIALIDPDSGSVRRLPKRHGKEIGSLAFAPSGRVLASVDWEGRSFLWDLDQAGDPAQPLPEPLEQVAFSPDGRWLAAAAEGGLPLLLDAKSGKRAAPPLSAASYGKRVDRIAFSPDGAVAAFWTDSGLLLARLSGQPAATPVATPAWFTELRPLAPPDPPKPPPIARDGHVAGRITFEGKPVANADVVLTPSSQEWDDAKALGEQRTRSAVDGSFSFVALPRIAWGLHASVPGKLGSGGLVGMRERAELISLEVRLERRATLRGRLLDAKGRPVRRASVACKGESYYTNGFAKSVQTGEDGAFLIDLLYVGDYRLQAAGANGSLVTRHLQITQPVESTTELRLRGADDPAVLRVRVVFDSGPPVAGAKVRLGGYGAAAGETDAQGRFATDDVDSKGRQLVASVEWQERRVASASLQSPFPGEVLLAIPDAEVLLLGGTEPGAFAVLREEERRPGELPTAVRFRTKEKLGERYAGLAPGRYVAWLRTADGRFGSASLELRKGDKREVRVRLRGPVALRGRVVDEATGRPLAGLKVRTYALLATSGAIRERFEEVDVATAPDGRFVLRGLSPGRHVLVLGSHGSMGRRVLATAPDVGESDLGDVTVPAPGRFEEMTSGLSTLAEARGARVTRSRYPAVQAGDLILEVNGASAVGMESDEIEALLDLKDPARLVIEPLNGPQGPGQRRQLTLPPRRVISGQTDAE